MFDSCKLLGTLKLGLRKGLSRPELASLQMRCREAEGIAGGGRTPQPSSTEANLVPGLRPSKWGSYPQEALVL